MTERYNRQEVIAATQVTDRQLRYWEQIGFLVLEGSGYTFQEVLLIHLVIAAKAKGHSFQHMRRVVAKINELLKKWTTPITHTNIYFSDKLVLLYSGDMLACWTQPIDPLIVLGPMVARALGLFVDARPRVLMHTAKEPPASRTIAQLPVKKGEEAPDPC